MIDFHHVTKRFGDELALDDVSIHVSQGELVVLLGASGTGKSTFLKLISFEERPTTGEVVVGSWRSSTARAAQVQRLRRRLGIIYQDFKLLPDRTVFENVALPLRVAGAASSELHRRVEAALERVGLARHGAKRLSQISGGQQQRVAVARALVHRPDVVLADEPTGNLDPDMSQAMMELFRQLRSEGTAVVLATYDLSLIQPGDRVVRLERARLVEGA
ncbi:MAG TPA: ATP-binding cassette domain-containing protein [Candidatus Saccharimonadales bacterium]|nr:ATP-binding cassette domain-containing protein [Candidatus Saccharimonadales bacterium]